MVKKGFVSGHVITMGSHLMEASAFGCVGDRFYIVGSDEEITAWAGQDATIINMKGKTVTPGFIETHNHLSHFSETLSYVDCGTPPNESIHEVKTLLRKKLNTLTSGQWVVGKGYDDTLVNDKRHLTRSDLDEISDKNPMVIFHISGHLVYANSMALEMSGIGPQTPQPEGGEIHKDKNGIPTGLLLEPSAMMPVTLLIPRPSLADHKERLMQGIAHFHENGITSIHDGGVGRYGTLDFRAFRELESEGKLNLRTYMTTLEIMYQRIYKTGLGPGFGSHYLKLGAVKMFQDGSIQGMTGALKEPYFNNPDIRGDLIHTQGALEEMVLKYHRTGMQIAVHANGDRAIESIITAFEKADNQFPNQDLRHMIIHCQTAGRDHIVRMKRLGIIPSYFVNHVYYWGDRHESIFLGPERAARISPLATSLKEGLIFTLHSDLPVTPVSPLDSIHHAVNRITREGNMLGPEERVSPLEALKAYSTYAAYCSYEEDIKGSIETGKLADFTVLSNNPLTVDPEKIRDIRVEQTWVGGRKVYQY